MDKISLVFVGNKYYAQSGTRLGALYVEGDGGRTDWGKVQVWLKQGHAVNIRPATLYELQEMDKKLEAISAEVEARDKADGFD